ncbi:TPA: hypothetical protein ENX78_12850 [Candidatus Poribacteria bacterium]|jgi:hypothetical protein|nr:hypothetical protein [Candidatus Poribacteria bacterium]
MSFKSRNLLIVARRLMPSIHSIITDKNKLIFTVITIVFTFVILGYLIFSQWHILVTYNWKLRPIYLVVAFVIYSLILLFNTLTWTSIIRNFGSKKDFGIHFRSTTISALGKRLPGTFWYVIWRAQLYKEEFTGPVIAYASGVEMVITVIAAIIISSIFAIPLILKYQYSLWVIVLMLIICIVVLHPKILAWSFKKLKLNVDRIPYKFYLFWVGLYLIIWLLVGLLLFLFGNFFSDIPINDLPYFIGSTALTGVISRLLLFSPSTFGFGEISLSLLLSNILPSSFAVVIAISNRIFIISYELIWALISTLSTKSELQSQN